MSENKLVDKFVKEISQGIPAWIIENMPKSQPYELQLDDADILANAFVNFAAINCALLTRSMVDKMLPLRTAGISEKEFRQSHFELMDRKFKILFTKVLMQNMEEGTV